MKVSEVSGQVLPAEGGPPPMQAMVYEEIVRRGGEVFEYQGDELLQALPRLKRSALNWTLYLLTRNGLIGKARIRLEGRLTTVYGSHDAIALLRERMGKGSSGQ